MAVAVKRDVFLFSSPASSCAYTNPSRLTQKFGNKPKAFGGKIPSRLIGLPALSLATDVSEEPQIEEASSPVQQLYKGKKAVVVGAGPAGLVAAAYLARHGFSVKVFEGRKDIRSEPVSGQRAYNVILFGSTPDVLADVGVELPSADGGFKSGLHAFKGVHSWMADGSVIPDPAIATNKILGTRNSITRGILDTVDKNCSASVDFVFSHPCTGVAFTDQKAKFKGDDGREVTVDYDLLIAADGTNSKVQKELQDFDRSLKVLRGPAGRLYMGVDLLKIPEKSNACYDILKPGWMSFGFIPGSKAAKDYSTTFGFSLTPDNDVHLIFGAISEFFEVIKGQEKEYIDDVLPKDIPQEWKERILHRIRKGQLSRSPPTVLLNKFNGPRTILMGDAAHGVTPAMGLGCNMAITDGKALSDALYAAGGDPSLVPQKFNDLRYQTVRSYQLIETGISAEGKRMPGLFSIWHFLCGVHLRVYRFLAKASSNSVRSVHRRVQEGQLSSIEGLNIIKRDIFIGAVIAIGMLFALVRHVLMPAARYLISRFPLV